MRATSLQKRTPKAKEQHEGVQKEYEGHDEKYSSPVYRSPSKSIQEGSSLFKGF
jgi:hypothetical protein